VLVLVLLSVWALPTSAAAPTRTMEFLFTALFVGMILWPNYLALSLPGLPWITWIRLTGWPMAILFLVSLSISPTFRSDLGNLMRAASPLWTVVLVFIALQFITLPLAKSVGPALQRSLVQQVNWTCIFLIAAYVCQTPGRTQRYVNLLFVVSLPVALVAWTEAREQHVLWAGLVPSFLRVEDPAVKVMLDSAVRSTGVYRVKATFSTPLGLAEYIALLTPFAIHFAVGPYGKGAKIAGIVLLPVIFYVVRLTDSRLGIVGFLSSFVAYTLLWALVRYRRTRGDLVSSAIVYAYPLVTLLFFAAINSSARINSLILGDGSTTASTESRKTQLLMGVPEILKNPLGHGSGGAGAAMGYAQGEFVTVDNYYLTIGLDYGPLGLTTFLALFLVAIAVGVRNSVTAAGRKDPELLLLVPLTAALVSFLVIKSVFSQTDSHPIIFMMIGMIVALAYRAKNEDPDTLASNRS
jgi:hypothetical protein